MGYESRSNTFYCWFIHRSKVDPRYQRREKTYTIRHFVQTKISSLGLEDRANFYIGHYEENSCYKPTVEEQDEAFRKSESELTFLGYFTLEQKSDGRIEALEQENMAKEGPIADPKEAT